MEGLTGIHTNYVSWGNGRDWFINGDKNYRGGKEAWRKSGPGTASLKTGSKPAGLHRCLRQSESMSGLQVAANGDVRNFVLPAREAQRPLVGAKETPMQAPLKGHQSSGCGTWSSGNKESRCHAGSKTALLRWQHEHWAPLPPAKGLDTHRNFLRWVGMDQETTEDTSMAQATVGRPRSPPLGRSRRQAAVSLGVSPQCRPRQQQQLQQQPQKQPQLLQHGSRVRAASLPNLQT